MKLNDVYTSILEAAAFCVDKDGYVSINNQLFVGTPNEPATLGGKRLVLPTDEHLRNPAPESKVIFHPLREQAMKGESDVVAKLRSALVVRLNFAIGALMSELLGIAADVSKHKLLTPDQSEMLVAGKDVVEDTQIAFSDLLMRVYDSASNRGFVSIYLKKSGVVLGTSYFRVGVVSFPFYEELAKEQDKYFGVTLTKKTRQSLLSMFEYLIPRIESVGAYNQGSNSAVAPIMDSLMRSFGGVASRINDKIELFKDVFAEPGGEKLIIQSAWEDAFVDLDTLRPLIHLVPIQTGNEGQSTVVQQPVVQTTVPVVVNHTAQHQSPIASFMHQHSQPQVIHQPVMQQPIVQQPTGLERTASGGITFQSALRNLPGAAQTAVTSVTGMLMMNNVGLGMRQTDPNAPRSSGGSAMPGGVMGVPGYPLGGNNPQNVPSGAVMLNGVMMVPVNTNQITGRV